MKKFLVALLLVVLACTVAYAKVTDLEIEFTIDSEFEPYIDSYKVYTEVPGTGAIIHVATFTEAANFVAQLTALDLDPGKVTNFYLGAIYGTDAATEVEDRSVAFPFKFTGKPVLIRIQKQ